MALSAKKMVFQIKSVRSATVFFATSYAAYLLVVRNIDTLPSIVAYTPYLLVTGAGWIVGLKFDKSLAKPCVTVGIIAAVIAGGLNLVLWAFGVPVDFGGFKGTTIATLLMLPGFILLALLGGAVASEGYGEKRT